MTGSEVGVFSLSALDGMGGQHQTLSTLPLLKDPGTNCRVCLMGSCCLDGYGGEKNLLNDIV